MTPFAGCLIEFKQRGHAAISIAPLFANDSPDCPIGQYGQEC